MNTSCSELDRDCYDRVLSGGSVNANWRFRTGRNLVPWCGIQLDPLTEHANVKDRIHIRVQNLVRCICLFDELSESGYIFELQDIFVFLERKWSLLLLRQVSREHNRWWYTSFIRGSSQMMCVRVVITHKCGKDLMLNFNQVLAIDVHDIHTYRKWRACDVKRRK